MTFATASSLGVRVDQSEKRCCTGRSKYIALISVLLRRSRKFDNNRTVRREIGISALQRADGEGEGEGLGTGPLQQTIQQRNATSCHSVDVNGQCYSMYALTIDRPLQRLDNVYTACTFPSLAHYPCIRYYSRIRGRAFRSQDSVFQSHGGRRGRVTVTARLFTRLNVPR